MMLDTGIVELCMCTNRVYIPVHKPVYIPPGSGASNARPVVPNSPPWEIDSPSGGERGAGEGVPPCCEFVLTPGGAELQFKNAR